MSVSPEVAMRTFVQRQAALLAEWRARAAQLVADVHAHVPALAATAGAERVWLFGSLAWGEPHEHNDVDLAVAGLDELACDRFAAEAYMAIGAPVDVVRLETAPPSLADRIVAAGLVIYPPRRAP